MKKQRSTGGSLSKASKFVPRILARVKKVRMSLKVFTGVLFLNTQSTGEQRKRKGIRVVKSSLATIVNCSAKALSESPKTTVPSLLAQLFISKLRCLVVLFLIANSFKQSKVIKPLRTFFQKLQCCFCSEVCIFYVCVGIMDLARSKAALPLPLPLKEAL